MVAYGTSGKERNHSGVTKQSVLYLGTYLFKGLLDVIPPLLSVKANWIQQYIVIVQWNYNNRTLQITHHPLSSDLILTHSLGHHNIL